MLKHFAIAVFSLCAAVPVAAQDVEDGPSMMERGAQDFLEGLLLEMEPAWREILDNGDIIIRRKPAPQDPITPDPEPLPQIEL